MIENENTEPDWATLMQELRLLGLYDVKVVHLTPNEVVVSMHGLLSAGCCFYSAVSNALHTLHNPTVLA